MRVKDNAREKELVKLQQGGEVHTQEANRVGEGVGSGEQLQFLQSGVQHIENTASQGDLVKGVGAGWEHEGGEMSKQMEFD